VITIPGWAASDLPQATRGAGRLMGDVEGACVFQLREPGAADALPNAGFEAGLASDGEALRHAEGAFAAAELAMHARSARYSAPTTRSAF
jgi:hypothetical protein